MSKWAILRSAILTKASEEQQQSAAEATENASIHRHDGFHMFDKFDGLEQDDCGMDSAELAEARRGGFDVARYRVPALTSAETTAVHVLERRVGAKLSLAELAPHKGGHGEGVDNTGNVRVWPAEEVLLHVTLASLRRLLFPGTAVSSTSSAVKTVLSQAAHSGVDSFASESSSAPASFSTSDYPALLPSSFIRKGQRRVLELGGGMTALAAVGFAVGASGMTVPKVPQDQKASVLEQEGASALGDEEGAAGASVPLIGQLTVTDGNPVSVEKQASTLSLNRRLLPSKCVAGRLFWELHDEQGTEAALVSQVLNHPTGTGGQEPPRPPLPPVPAHCAGLGAPGSECEALWKMGRKWYKCKVAGGEGPALKPSSSAEGCAGDLEWTWSLEYEDGDRWDAVPAHKIRTALGSSKDPRASGVPSGSSAVRPAAAGEEAVADSASSSSSKGCGSEASPSESSCGGGGGGEARPADGVKYDLILGADLLFFESHAALAACLDRLLVNDDEGTDNDGSRGGGEGGGCKTGGSSLRTGGGGGGGTVLLCQPSRKGTMEAFAAHPEVLKRFVVERFDAGGTKGEDSAGWLGPEVAALHQSYLGDPNFNPSLHSPSVLRLTRRKLQLESSEN